MSICLLVLLPPILSSQLASRGSLGAGPPPPGGGGGRGAGGGGGPSTLSRNDGNQGKLDNTCFVVP